MIEIQQRAVELRGIEKSFRSPAGPVHAVRGVDLAIAPGEVVALLGPNGAGKSTTVDVLLGLTKADEGTAAIFGRAPAQAVRRGMVGAMLQTGSLPRDLTVRELVTVFASLYPKPLGVDEVLELVGITGRAERRTQKLSGGETQRVRFALALVTNPELLVLDEPTAAMDVEGRHAFWATMRAFAAQGKGPAGSCSRTRRRPSSPRRSAPSPRAGWPSIRHWRPRRSRTARAR